jgi:hypothetical protein
VNPTYIEVDPAEFENDVACASSGGNLRWYVATLVDVTPDQDGKPLDFRLPSSPPTNCSESVFFSGVVAQGFTLGVWHEAHRYVAEIEGYRESSLRPQHEGSRVMTSGGKTVDPDWVGSCGSAKSSLDPLLGVDAGSSDAPDAGFETHFLGPAMPFPSQTVTIHGCSLTSLAASSDETRIAVDISSALGQLECGNEPGQVARFEATLGDEVRAADCGKTALFRNVPAENFVEFEVVAFTSSSFADGGAAEPEAAWTTTCYQKAALGQQLVARCDPLVPLE